MIEEYLRNNGLPYTFLRPTAFFETHAHMLIGEPLLEKGKIPIYGRGENPRNFIAAKDVAQITLLALENKSMLNKVDRRT